MFLIKFLYFARAREILVAGDSRISGWLWRRVPGWTVRTLARPGAQLPALITMCNENLRDETALIIIVALHCDLSYRTEYGTDGRKGLLRLRDPAPLADLTNLITTWDYTWHHERKIPVVWTLPYVPNFLRYNGQRARYRGITNLCELHVEEALWSARKMRDNLKNFGRILHARGLTTVEFEGQVSPYELHHNSDGVHLCPSSQQRLLDNMVQTALQSVNREVPVTLRKVLTPALRWAKAQKRRRYRHRKANGCARGTAPFDVTPGIFASATQPSNL